MKFNADKFQLLRLGTNQEKKEGTSTFTGDYDGLINPSLDIRDLGPKLIRTGPLKSREPGPFKRVETRLHGF